MNIQTKNETSEKTYQGYIIDRSQKDKAIFDDLKITNRKSILLGIVTIYEVEVEARNINTVIERIQYNMSSKRFLIFKEWYAHFYCGEELIVVYKEKVFSATRDKSTWDAATEYGRSLKIAKKQLDFLTPEENEERYFSSKK